MLCPCGIVVLRSPRCTGCCPAAGELRFQQLVVPAQGWPPSLTAKGLGVPFTAGSPLASVGPQQPGFSRGLGQDLFGQRGFLCEGSIK